MARRQTRKRSIVTVPAFGNISPIEGEAVRTENPCNADLIGHREKNKQFASTRIRLLTNRDSTPQEIHEDGEIEVESDLIGKNNETLAREMKELRDRLVVWMKMTDNRLDGMNVQLKDHAMQLSNFMQTTHERFDNVNRHNQLLNERLCQQEMRGDRLSNLVDRILTVLKPRQHRRRQR